MLDEFVASKLAILVNQRVVFLETLVEVLDSFYGPASEGPCFESGGIPAHSSTAGCPQYYTEGGRMVTTGMVSNTGAGYSAMDPNLTTGDGPLIRDSGALCCTGIAV